MNAVNVLHAGQIPGRPLGACVETLGVVGGPGRTAALGGSRAGAPAGGDASAGGLSIVGRARGPGERARVIAPGALSRPKSTTTCSRSIALHPRAPRARWLSRTHRSRTASLGSPRRSLVSLPAYTVRTQYASTRGTSAAHTERGASMRACSTEQEIARWVVGIEMRFW